MSHLLHSHTRLPVMSNNRSHYASERTVASLLGSRDPPIPLEPDTQDMQRKHPDSPAKPFFGAGGSMLKQFDEHHAGVIRKSSMESAHASATPPRSVVGIGGKGASCFAVVLSF